MKCKQWIMLSVAVRLMGSIALAESRLMPAAPIIDFKLPMFREEGYKAWDLRAQEGQFLSQEEVVVQGMVLKTYSSDEHVEPELTIESLKALIRIKDHKAYGDELIILKGPRYSVVGNGWSWNGNEKKIIVKENVRVTFEEPLNKVLKENEEI